jgi:hypothetical protein
METTQYGSYNPEVARNHKVIELNLAANPEVARKHKACPYRSMQACWEADCQMWDKKRKDCGLKFDGHISLAR